MPQAAYMDFLQLHYLAAKLKSTSTFIKAECRLICESQIVNTSLKMMTHVSIHPLLHRQTRQTMHELTILSIKYNAHANEAPVPGSLVLVPVRVHEGLADPGCHLHRHCITQQRPPVCLRQPYHSAERTATPCFLDDLALLLPQSCILLESRCIHRVKVGKMLHEVHSTVTLRHCNSLAVI